MLWGLIGCEFKIPTVPRLPSRWDTKVIVPLIDKIYPLSDLTFDSDANSSMLSISIDTTTGRLRYHNEDITSEVITVSDSFLIVPQLDITDEIYLSDVVELKDDSTFSLITIRTGKKIDTRNSRFYYGYLKDAEDPNYNFITLTASMNDTFMNPVKIKVVCENFKDDTLKVDSLYLPIGTLSDYKEIDVNGDSVKGETTDAYIDSLVFSILIEIEGILEEPVENIDEILTIDINVKHLYMDSFYGKANGFGELTPQILLNSPSGAEDILFDSATVVFTIEDATGKFNEVSFEVFGKKSGGNDVKIDTLFSIDSPYPNTRIMDISTIMAVLPDSIIVYATGSLEDATYSASSSINTSEGLSINYNVYIPMIFTLPVEMTIASANPTSFFIKDDSTRQNIARAQRGAEIDAVVENRTPFQGSIYLLISNYSIFPWDSIRIANSSDYQWFGDSLFYVGADTDLVLIDTLALLEIQQATYDGDSLVTPGVSNQIYLADSTVISIFSDSCYIMPHFRFVNPDTSESSIDTTQSIRIKSYLNFLLDPSVLSHQKTENADSL